VHTDKNQEDPVLAEEKFKEVQNAYEILSDKRERSWYDSHRDAILRSGARHQAGAGPSENRESPEDVVDLYYYFTSACYSGFGDGPKGFYSVFNELFKFLAEQEKQAMDKNGKQSSYPLPPFGLSGAPWSEVAFFYSQWSSFSTVRQFSWADAFNPTAARNRKVRRAVETENAKLRKAAKKEYNESVRSLVGFLKKRDKRVLAHQVEETRLRQEKEAAAQQK
jgi:DnaJ family protein A protein 5